MIKQIFTRHRFWLLSFCVIFSFVHLSADAPLAKKRILILSSSGGGGHTTVCRALESYIAEQYDLTMVNVFRDVLSSYDFLGFLTRGYFNGEDLYNFCLRRGWVHLIGAMLNWGSWYLCSRASVFSKQMEAFVKEKNPDLIISVVPLVNGIVMPVAQELNIPFLVLTNDLDTSNYLRGIDSFDYEKFYYTFTSDDELLMRMPRQRGIAPKHMRITGFPLRPDFYRSAPDLEAIRKDFGVEPEKRVVMLLMGGTGSISSYRYVSSLAQLHYPIHIIACLGSNESVRSKIDAIELPPYISVTTVGYTNRIADLMSISDLLITKSGPGSVMEALTLQVPLLIDKTADILPWEKMNIDFVLKHGCGGVITDEDELSDLLYQYLIDIEYRVSLKENLRLLNSKIVRFDTKIHELLAEILGESS